MIEYFKRSAAAKAKTAAHIKATPALRNCLTSLLERSRKGGMIYCAGDRDSRFSVDHLCEELQVSFRGGKPLGRPSRGAVSAVSLSHYEASRLPTLLDLRLEPNDVLVVFSSGCNSLPLKELAAIAEKRKVFTVFVGRDVTQISSTDVVKSIPIEDSENGILFSAQRAALHAFCEPFEPEFDANGADYLYDIFAASAELDKQVAANSDFITLCEKARDGLVSAINSGAALYTFGNGGSACDADEIAAEFQTRFDSQKRPVVAMSFLQAGYLTCAVNDGFPIFRRGIEGIPNNRGVIIALSTSGNSPNVIEATSFARKKGLLTIGFIGKSGGDMAKEVDVPLIVPSKTTERIQEVHTLIGFWLASQLS